MRILFVISGLGLGGAERQVVLLARELVQRGHEVSVYTLTRELARADEWPGAAADLVVDHKRRRLDGAVLFRLRRHVRRWRPDVVHGMLYDGNVYARLACAGLGVPVFNSERNDNYRLSFLQAAGYRLTRGLVDALVANSHAGAAFARGLHGLAESRVHVVWNGLDLGEIDRRVASAGALASELSPGSGLKRVCIVGSIKPAKDHALALRVMRYLLDRDPSWRLLCAGDDLDTSNPSPLKRRVYEQCEQLGLRPFVSFLGQRRDVPELMASCDALLVTSLHEGFPNVVLEAMACGLPVASTDYSDIRRILPFAWQVSEDRSAESLALALSRCVAESLDVAARQRAWVEVHGTVASSASALLAAYAGRETVSRTELRSVS
jgi:glycosyltransferase involved in cell wall biosynthesis